MSACRADVQDRPDMLLHSIFLGDADKGLEVDLYVVLVLRACIVDKNLYIRDFRKVTADIA